MIRRFMLVGLVLLVHARSSVSQQLPARPLTLDEAVELAMKNYPAIRAARAQAEAARASVDLARTAYLPRTDLLWQENRATRNNVFGMLLPQSAIPPISGPVLGTTSFDSAWGSAGGMLASWEPFDFGYRKANVAVARATSDKANATADLTQLDAAASAAEAFLAAIAAGRTVVAARANVERLEVFARSLHVLVENQLRPGADASRADAEIATARNFLIQAEQNAETSLITLSEALGLAGTSMSPDPGSLVDRPPQALPPISKPESHPLALAQAASVSAAQARERALERSYYPRFNYQFALYGRGSGALLDGRLDPRKGLLPDVPNWATGVSITFPALDIFGIRARRRAEASISEAEKARYDQTLQSLRAQDDRANALVKAAVRISENTPVQLKAAQETESRARARYEAGLGNIVEVADAQRLLTQAEIEQEVARLSIWHAHLVAAKARGDIRPFIEYAKNARK